MRLLLVHAHAIIGQSIVAALQDQHWIAQLVHVIGIEAARAALQKEMFDMVVVSATSPDEGVRRLISYVADRHASTKIFVVSVPGSTHIVLDFLERGVTGYTTENESLDSFREKLYAMRNGEFPLLPVLAPHLFSRISELKRRADAKVVVSPPAPWLTLTSQERKIFNLMARGYTNQEIADSLTIEIGTTKSHINKIFRKLDIKNREETVHLAQLVG